MLFGLTNAPVTFQSFIPIFNEWEFQALSQKEVCIVFFFFYDILVYRLDLSSYLKHLEVVFQVLQNQQLFAK